eukprot:Phypoly_transcript_07140.p1 GENE.Phypoly_transcript_07140~~Phypoly_transcript_07140.p1  ORF type:complete len:451 (+),score=36.16 Phypoly_transcript_07140:269-1621(+)
MVTIYTMTQHNFYSLVVILFLYIPLAVTAPDKTLRFNERGKFKIVQFTDLHYGYDEHENQLTSIVQDVILDAEKPDLVIITGDLVSGYEWRGMPWGWFKSLWEKLIAPMEKRGIRWAVALGNHDVEGDLDGEEIVTLDRAHDLSLTQHSPQDISGATNYYLPIYSYDPQNRSTNIGQILWVFDSGSNGCMGVDGWGCIMYDQVAWYMNTSRALTSTRGSPIPSLAFFHIPLYEHLDLWNVNGVEGNLGDEGVCCSAVNTGLYSAMRQMGDITGVYCGHDHSNDFIGDYHGIVLGYGRKTGYGCYGPPLGWKHGARVLEISQNEFGARTWLRLEDGSVEIQKKNPVSYKKYIGCCHMEGHKHMAMTWLDLLVLFLYVIAIGGIVTCLVRVLVRLYRKRSGKTRFGSILGGKDDKSEGEGESHNWKIKNLPHLWADEVPGPRQRRVNELESV